MKIKLKPMKKPHLFSSSRSTTSSHNKEVVEDHHRRLSLPIKPTMKSPSSNVVCDIDDGSTNKLWDIDTAFGPSFRARNDVSLTTDDLPPDFSRASAEFYTPTYQAMKNSTFFSSKQRDRHDRSNKRLSNASTLYYEPTILDGYDYEVSGFLPRVSEEFSLIPRKGESATTPLSPSSEDFAKATPVDCQINHKPRPFREFLNEVESQKQRAEIDAPRKENYTSLLRKLRIKEDAIDAWESKQKSKAEDQLDKLERRLEKKRAKAVQRTNKKLVEIEQETEKRKAIARKSVLNEMSKLHIGIY